MNNLNGNSMFLSNQINSGGSANGGSGANFNINGMGERPVSSSNSRNTKESIEKTSFEGTKY